jgi:hypothetical protein
MNVKINNLYAQNKEIQEGYNGITGEISIIKR